MVTRQLDALTSGERVVLLYGRFLQALASHLVSGCTSGHFPSLLQVFIHSKVQNSKTGLVFVLDLGVVRFQRVAIAQPLFVGMGSWARELVARSVPQADSEMGS